MSTALDEVFVMATKFMGSAHPDDLPSLEQTIRKARREVAALRLLERMRAATISEAMDKGVDEERARIIALVRKLEGDEHEQAKVCDVAREREILLRKVREEIAASWVDAYGTPVKS